MIDLDEHYAGVAEEFLQTAIVIDDQAQFGAVVTMVPTSPVVAPAAGILEAAASSEPAAPTDEPNVTVTIEPEPSTPSAKLDAKTLSEAFLAKRMICGLYRPSSGEDMVPKSIGVARTADVVVVDWHLVEGSSRQAKDIVIGLLEADRLEKGRLRLIAIYTSQPGCEAIAKDLLAAIEASGSLKDVLKRHGAVLESADTRIVILNKMSTPDAADRDAVPEEALPSRLISEFAKLSRGLLASFALSSIAAVRRGAHHVLALYKSKIDGAFVAHRCAIPNPEDSKTFALDLISSELRNLIEVDDVPEQTLGEQIVTAWIEAKAKSGHAFKTEHAQIPAAEVQKIASGGLAALLQSKERHHIPGSEDRSDRPVKPETVARVFYDNADEAKEGARRLSSLSTFERERSRTRLPDEWRPKLTLGTVLKRITEDDNGEMLLCVQPRCDAIRLEGRTAFPFQTITVGGNAFNLVVPGSPGDEIEVWVNMKPRDARMIEFDPDEVKKAVYGTKDEASGTLVFRDGHGQTYTWIGDIKAMKAQRWVAELGARVQAVGMEELEWLRLASEGKVKVAWAN